MTVHGIDSKCRCFGGQEGKELYGAYHDTEWGRPIHNEHMLFEMLILEGAQAGLTWETILKRREGYRACFHHFDPIKVSTMTDKELMTLTSNPGIIRHSLKIYAARKNAQIFLKIQEEFGSFNRYIWGFVHDKPIKNAWKTFQEVPTSSHLSVTISKDLKKRGMSFVGPTIIYAYMQAIGLVWDHLTCCFLYDSFSDS